MPFPGLSDFLSWFPSWLISVFDVVLVVILVYVVIRLLGEPQSRSRWIIQGFIILVATLLITIYFSRWLQLRLLQFVLEKMLIGS
ncbi:MAG: TIGR00159 family protein, partial [Halothece sp. Uz-M2-17]|nr:TIGR00159 family protein [Halothece sp. Uz-M2-17]